MKRKWTKALTGIAISAALISNASVITAFADEAQPAAAYYETQYQLTNVLKAGVKSVLNERSGQGRQIGAVVKLENTGSKVTRVPEYEVRARTKDGIEYTLQPSLANVKSIQPKEKVELSYLLQLDRQDTVELSEVFWVDINEYVYPKEETVVLTVPVDNIAWKGTDDAITEPSAIKKWGESFSLPVLNKNLEFIPQHITDESTDKGPATLVTLLTENKGDSTETVPAFSLDGRSEDKVFPGRLVESNVQLKPGEKKNIHVLIPTDTDVTLKSLNVVSQETFVKTSLLGVAATANPQNGAANANPQGGAANAIPQGVEVTNYTVGRLNILLPSREQGAGEYIPEYKLGDKIAFDPYSKLVDKNLDVSLVELTLNGNELYGYQTVIAKLLLKNNGERPLSLPALGLELSSADGYTYSGERQAGTVQSLAPKLSYVVNYAFAVPSSESGEKLVLKLLDNKIAEPYGVPISSYKVAVQPADESGNLLSFYPFTVNLKSWTLQYSGGMSLGIYYNYHLKLDLDIEKKEDVVVDLNSSYLKAELEDSSGRVFGSQNYSFVGPNRLISGEQTLTFPNVRTDELNYPATIKLYEAIQTPNGEAKRLIKTLKQQ